MDIMSMKGHPPWYARGTPVTNIRDGPAMAINDKLLFAICRGSSARGKPGESMNEVGRPKKVRIHGKNPPLADFKHHIFQHSKQCV